MFLELTHERLDVFYISKEFVTLCYKATGAFPNDERFALTQQIRRASVSVHLNIAEGCSRRSLLERKRFFEISRGSLIEVDAAFDIALDLHYIKKDDLLLLGDKLKRSFQMLSKLINSYPHV